MLTLPSMWGLIISTLVFFIAVAYLRRYLDEQGIPKGTTRATVDELLAWGAEMAASWAQETMEGPPPAVQVAPDPAAPTPKEDDLSKP